MACLTSSVLTLSAISCDRFVAIMFPLHVRITKQRTSVVITIVWIVSAVVSIPLIIVKKYVVIVVCIRVFVYLFLYYCSIRLPISVKVISWSFEDVSFKIRFIQKIKFWKVAKLLDSAHCFLMEIKILQWQKHW